MGSGHIAYFIDAQKIAACQFIPTDIFRKELGHIDPVFIPLDFLGKNIDSSIVIIEHHLHKTGPGGIVPHFFEQAVAKYVSYEALV
jgi:hypothetical protein